MSTSEQRRRGREERAAMVGETKHPLTELARSSRLLREDLQPGFKLGGFHEQFWPETHGIVVANIYLAITKLPNDQMKRILLLSILCPQFVARICWGGDGLDTWTVRSNSLSSTSWLYDVACGNDQFVAVGGSQAQIHPDMGVVLTSLDRTNWLQEILPTGTETLLGVTHAAGFYLAVGVNSLLTSFSGTSWVRSTSVSFSSSAVAYGNGLFIACGGYRYLYLSTNASTWRPVSAGLFESYPKDIAFGHGQFVAVSSGMTVGLWTSTNGTAWGPRFWAPGASPTSVSYCNGLFVATGRAGTIVTSTDGITWNQRNSGTRSNLLGVASGAGVYVTVGSGGTILTSPDGTTWRGLPSGVTNDLTAVTYGNGHFVAVGSSGVILESGPVMHLGLPKMLSPDAMQFTLTGPVGQLCQIQMSADFANWVAITKLLLAEPSTTFVIISSNRPSRLFYQIAAP